MQKSFKEIFSLTKPKKFWGLVLSLFAIVLFWFLLASILESPIILPSPLDTFWGMLDLFQEAGFWVSVLSTIVRVLKAFVLALGICIPLGICMGKNEFVRWFFEPVQAIFRSTPVIAVILLTLIWFKTGDVPIFVAFLMIFPIILESVSNGTRKEDPLLKEMAQSFHVRGLRYLRFVNLPSLRPVLNSSGKTALGIAWKVVAAAEVLALPAKGLGTMMQEGRLYLDTPRVFGLTLCLIVLSFLADVLWDFLVPGSNRQGLCRFVRKLVLFPEARNFTLNRSPSVPGELAAGIVPHEPLEATLDRPSLELKNLSFSYPDEDRSKKILDSYSLQLAQGEILGLRGVSGAGKTSITRLILGFEKPESGELTCHLPCSPVFQEARLLPWLDGWGNVRALGHLYQKTADTTAFYAELLEINENLHQFPDSLSGGMRQRLALLRSLVWESQNPGIFIWDEPFQSLDEELKHRLLPKLRASLKAHNSSALIISHSSKELEVLCDRIQDLPRLV